MKLNIELKQGDLSISGIKSRTLAPPFRVIESYGNGRLQHVPKKDNLQCFVSFSTLNWPPLLFFRNILLVSYEVKYRIETRRFIDQWNVNPRLRLHPLV